MLPTIKFDWTHDAIFSTFVQCELTVPVSAVLIALETASSCSKTSHGTCVAASYHIFATFPLDAGFKVLDFLSKLISMAASKFCHQLFIIKYNQTGKETRTNEVLLCCWLPLISECHKAHQKMDDILYGLTTECLPVSFIKSVVFISRSHSWSAMAGCTVK